MKKTFGSFLYILGLIIVSSLLFVGCAKKTTVVLLPDPDGKVGHVYVKNEAGEMDVTEAGSASTISGSSAPSEPVKVSQEKIESDFGEALEILPVQPSHFILYFSSGTSELTNKSMKLLPQVLAEIDKRKSQNISVIGHTDTAGNEKYNTKLSQKRASVVREILISKGVDSTYIHSTSHGEQNPLVKTADNVSEPRNRRVEVVVK